jgi:hypothetical protein
VGLRYGYVYRPSDFNGDGCNDIVTWNVSRDIFQGIQIYFSGADFDTIPEWILHVGSGVGEYVQGGDLNDDGYDDLLYRGDTYLTYRIFLGGSPMDTVPFLEFEYNMFDEGEDEYPDRMSGSFNILPDVNADGYDEFGVWYSEFHPDPHRPVTEEGYRIFFGGEELDLEPDLVLRVPESMDAYGNIIGGDFNGDGYGDIVNSDVGGGFYEGRIYYYFGSPWIDDEPDIAINGERDYDRGGLGYVIGAPGDYNGDGVDDLVVKTSVGIVGYTELYLLAGNRDWQVNVPEEKEVPQTFTFSLKATPNPFNDQIRLSYRISHPTNISLNVFDIQGRLVKQVYKGYKPAGEYTALAEGFNSGIYFIVLQTGQGRAVRKVVCLK